MKMIKLLKLKNLNMKKRKIDDSNIINFFNLLGFLPIFKLN